MSYEPCHAQLKSRDLNTAIDVLMFHLYAQRPLHQAADIEKTQASFVLFIRFGRLVNDPRIQQGNRVTAGTADERSSPAYADLRGSKPDAFGERMYLRYALHRGDELCDHAPRILRLGRKFKRPRWRSEDLVTFLYYTDS